MPLGSSSDAPVTSPGPSASITERSLPTRPVVTGVSAESPWPTLGIMLSVLLRLLGGAAIVTLPSESVSHNWLYFVVVVAVDKWKAAFCFPLIHILFSSVARRQLCDHCRLVCPILFKLHRADVIQCRVQPCLVIPE